MKEIKLVISGKKYTVKIEKRNNRYEVFVNGKRYEVLIPREEIAIENKERIGVQEAKNGIVLAPMPGKITKILVNVGDSVKMGDCLLKFEAMKMENEVVSPRNGVVKKVKVSLGKDINEGDVLMVIE